MIDWTMQLSDVVKILGMLVSAVYVVARIEFTTAKLTLAIDHLTKKIDSLTNGHESHVTEVSKIKERLAVMEDRIERQH